MATPNNQSNSKENTNKLLKVLAEVNAVKYPVICDPIGFMQHSGECWHDSLLQVLIFSDMTANIVQPILHSINTEEDAKQLITTYIETPIYPFLLSYIMNIAKRFQIHYKMINQINKKCNNDTTLLECLYNIKHSLIKRPILQPSTCANNLIGVITSDNTHASSNSNNFNQLVSVKRQISGETGVASAKYGQSILLGEESTKTGGQMYDERMLLTILNSIFNINVYVSDTYEFYSNNPFNKPFITPGRRNIIMTGKYLDSTTNNIYHATAFYWCNNKLHYYDDNSGIYTDIVLSKNLREFGFTLNDVFKYPSRYAFVYMRSLESIFTLDTLPPTLKLNKYKTLFIYETVMDEDIIARFTSNRIMHVFKPDDVTYMLPMTDTIAEYISKDAINIVGQGGYKKRGRRTIRLRKNRRHHTRR
jgi:hypothetical protein